jgi:hypothetical protein
VAHTKHHQTILLLLYDSFREKVSIYTGMLARPLRPFYFLFITGSMFLEDCLCDCPPRGQAISTVSPECLIPAWIAPEKLFRTYREAVMVDHNNFLELNLGSP